MGLFAWKPEYAVHIPVIDEQHKRLFEIADQLHTAMMAGKANDSLGRILDDLVAYTKGHFATEERLMSSHNYPDLVRHKAEHERLTGQVVQFQRNFEAGKVMMTVEMLTFLRNWLDKHIRGTDQRVGAFLNGKAA